MKHCPKCDCNVVSCMLITGTNKFEYTCKACGERWREEAK